MTPERWLAGQVTESPRQREARLWSDVATATIAAHRTLQISDRGYAAIMRALLSA